MTAAVSAADSAPLLLREHALALQVTDVDAAAEAATAAAKDAGGTVQSRSGGQLSLAVPEARAADFVRRLGQLGDLVRETSQARDVGFEAADLEAAARAARARRAELETLRVRTQQVEEALLVERRIAHVDAQLAAAESDLRALRLKATRAHFSVELLASPVETLPATSLPFPWLDTLAYGELMNPSPRPRTPRLTSNGDVAMGIELRRLADRPAPGEDSYGIVPAMVVRGANTDPVGFAGGVDLKFGGVVDGVVYELRGLAGLGTAIGTVVTLGLMGGVGFSGWGAGRVPSSLELPLELFAFVELGAVGRLSLFAQPRWAVTREARRGARDSSRIFDEYTTGGAVILPFVFGDDDVKDGGLRLGFEYAEVMEEPLYAVTAGIGIGFPSFSSY